MNPITAQIAQLIAARKDEQESEALIYAITRHGSIDDARFLLPYFLQTKDSRLLLPIQAHGNAPIADEIFANAIQDGTLKEDFPYETLAALSYLQHAPTETVLMDYYKGMFSKNLPWDLHVTICLALLNYPCKGYENDIKAEIEKCLSESLFPEMVPALAVKTGDDSLAEKLYHHGCTKASSDASAGLILGIALFGKNSRDLFKKIILNPDWEAASTGTGNVRYTLMGMSYLNITFAELFADIKAIAPTEKERMYQHLFLLADLLHEKLRCTSPYPVRAISLHPEPAAQVYTVLFSPPDGNSVFKVTDQYVSDQRLKDAINQEFSEVEDAYRAKMAQEV